MHSEPLSKHISKCLLTLNALFFVAYASADIDISERNGGRVVALEVNDASRAEVLEALAERFDISVGGEATHWSDVPIELSVSGDLETVLNALLQDTSAVYGYFTSRSGDTRINSVTLLNRGKGGFVASPAPATPTPAARQVREIGTGLRDRNGVEQTVVLDPGLTAGVSSGDSPSRLSSSLERRARMTAGTRAEAGATVQTDVTLEGDAKADMQALTRQALQDVQNLAEALRRAEAPR